MKLSRVGCLVPVSKRRKSMWIWDVSSSAARSLFGLLHSSSSQSPHVLQCSEINCTSFHQMVSGHPFWGCFFGNTSRRPIMEKLLWIPKEKKQRERREGEEQIEIQIEIKNNTLTSSGEVTLSLMDRVYDCDNRFVPPKIKVFYLVFLGNEDLGKKEATLISCDTIVIIARWLSTSTTTYELKALNTTRSRHFFSGTVTFGGGITRNATFLKFTEQEKELAQTIFECSSMVNHKAILRPWFYTYSEEQQCWLICYDEFFKTVEEWLSGTISSKKIPYDDQNTEPLMKKWWRDTISLLLTAVKEIHDTKLLHMGLNMNDNYIIFGDEIKIINVMSTAAIQCPKRRHARTARTALLETKQKNDMTDLRDMLKKWLDPIPSVTWITGLIKERDLFLSYFDVYDNSVYNKLVKHPFLKDGYHRFLCCSQMRMVLNNTILLDPIIEGNVIAHLTNMNYGQWQLNPMSAELVTVYNYNGRTVLMELEYWNSLGSFKIPMLVIKSHQAPT